MVTEQHGHSKVTIRVDQAKYVKQFRAGIENDVASAKWSYDLGGSFRKFIKTPTDRKGLTPATPFWVMVVFKASLCPPVLFGDTLSGIVW